MYKNLWNTWGNDFKSRSWLVPPDPYLEEFNANDIGHTATSTQALLGGKAPQELHPSLNNN